MIALLFDIDGTLIATGGAGQTALEKTFAEEFGIASTHRVAISGRTDRSIIGDLFRLHAIPETPENWERFRQAYLHHLPQQLQARPGRVLPGIPSLLASLAKRDDVACGLLTGNLREGARIKLEHFSIRQHFAFGGFGDDALDRNHVAEVALAEAQRHVGDRLSRERTWVIGDTPLDIRCAKWVGVRVCAVTTGIHPREELAGDQPDLLLDDLADTERVVELLTG